MHPILRQLVALALLIGTTTQAAEQTRYEDYFEVMPLFWRELYAQGGETLYCGREFGRRAGRSINIEHVYPMAWVMRALGCESRDQCRRNSRRFNRIESDMHNLYPSLRDINKLRGSTPFGMVQGEQRRFDKCDFELDRKRRVVEPAPASRGNIARAMFHMSDSYGLSIFRRQAEQLLVWHRQDPPDEAEQRRNDLIEKLQGTRNRFIDDPAAAGRLRF